MTEDELGQALGREPGVVAAWLGSPGEIDAAVLAGIAAYFGMDPGDFLE